MDVKRVTDNFSVSDQLTAKDVPLLSAMGFRTLICNRPDGEDPFQALFEQILAASELSQITAIYLPVTQSGPSLQNIADFADAFAAAEKPVLAYCTTGDRSKVLFDASMRQKDNR
jgi:sulfide:quinone oxidoreductase